MIYRDDDKQPLSTEKFDSLIFTTWINCRKWRNFTPGENLLLYSLYTCIKLQLRYMVKLNGAIDIAKSALVLHIHYKN